MQKTDLYYQLAKHILPEDIASKFDIRQLSSNSDCLCVVLEEKLNYPSGYDAQTALPNGFYADSEIRDFPVREKKVFLRLKRRRWKDAATGKSIPTEEDQYVAQGTRYSKEFADFLKEGDGYLSYNSAFIRAFLQS